ncbi:MULTISPECIES: hypothetical protein [Aestuariimicrobium]|uniref:hypothetical protein n=1 Tax=Aestuariimicrobium TaxID=396388 RepID=UPI0003B499CA|nr:MULTISPECIES: hypothetical protein [Aestuariimicrobium]CAI9409341.1 hypothetical protein AESSP_02216 [Aestuariimicrobium sp. T2.26MG-19.2B]
MHLVAQFVQILLELPMDGLPGPRPTAPPGSDRIAAVLGWLMWSVGALCVLMAVAGSARLAAAHRRGERVGYGAVGIPIIGLILATLAACILTLFPGA